MLGLGAKINRSVKGRRAFTSKVAMDFVGSADAIIIPDHADFNHDTGSYSKFTVSFWFKADYSSGTLSDTEVLMGRWDLNDKREWFIYVGTDRVINIATSDDGTSGGNIKTHVTNHTISDTNWHHFIMRYDGSQSANYRTLVFIDGSIALSNSVGTVASGSFAQLHEADQDTWIAATHNNGTAERHFNGKVDEVAYWKGAQALGGTNLGFADYVYNNGNPRDLSYSDRNNELIGYWRLGEYYTAGCPIPSGTFPNSGTNPQDSSKYRGSCAVPLVALNWAGGKPRKVGDNLITNGNFVDGGPALAVDEDDETVNGWRAFASSAGAVITTDTSIYRSEGKAAKITTDVDGTYASIIKTTNAVLEDGECYVLEYWIYTPTDVSDAGSQEWGRTQCQLDECYEGDAQYGLSGDGDIAVNLLKINQWHRHICVGKYNKGSNATENVQIARQFGNLDAGEGPQILYVDDVSVYKLSGTHHGLVQSPGTEILTEGAD